MTGLLVMARLDRGELAPPNADFCGVYTVIRIHCNRGGFGSEAGANQESASGR